MKININKLSLIFLLPAVLNTNASAQQEKSYIRHPVSLSWYLSGVIKGNLGYIAEQFNVGIAEAELKAAGVFPDPEISATYSDNEDKRLQMGQSVEASISYTINMGNKRSAGIALARTQQELSRLMLDAYFKNLRADAALSYFTALREKKIYQLQTDIFEQIAGLARADSIRLQAGEATALDALQSSLESRAWITEVYQSMADMQNASVNLMHLQGKRIYDTIDDPSDDFPYKERNFNINDLIVKAVENRSDLLAAIKNKELSEKNLRLLKANRAFEFSLEAGYSYNSIVKNEIAPAPAYNGLSAGISIPLKISSMNTGSIRAAGLTIRQNQTLLEEAELEITSGIISAYNDFIAQNTKVEHYNLGLIDDARKILDGRIYSYQHGESDLLEVLNARRTYTEIRLNYLNALFEYTSALIELERAAGIWDLSN